MLCLRGLCGIFILDFLFPVDVGIKEKKKDVFNPLLKRPLEGKKYMPFPDNSSSFDYSILSPASQNPP